MKYKNIYAQTFVYEDKLHNINFRFTHTEICGRWYLTITNESTAQYETRVYKTQSSCFAAITKKCNRLRRIYGY